MASRRPEIRAEVYERFYLMRVELIDVSPRLCERVRSRLVATDAPARPPPPEGLAGRAIVAGLNLIIALVWPREGDDIAKEEESDAS